ncbi:MAG TPA: type IX secretion system membrane protein PorP/SprF [Draconibacterium sp.]|nr:type IX secretion system membrane protein PorP/SprF [Draconibacterium sp.]
MGKLNKIGLFVIVVLIMILPAKITVAQQDPLYTQYMDNLLVINPGFAGSKNIGNALVVARSQWVSFDGAPATRSFSYNTPIEQKNIGIGFSLMSDKIGPLKQTGAYVDYSYFLQLSSDFRLGMGLKAGVSFFRANLTDLITITPDPIFDNDIYENFLPNVGVGFYLSSEDTYFGLSVPRLIENRITRQEVSTEYVNKQQMHLYFVGGHTFDLNEEFQLKTSGMMKWVKNAPFSFDVNALVGFKEKFWLGAMYRLNAAYGVIAQFRPIPELTIGYSYDITITELGGYQSGSHEVMLSYDLSIFH